MDDDARGPYRVYFLEGSGECFGRELAALLAAIDERGEIVEHIATHAALTADGQWRQAAQVVGRVATELDDPVWRFPHDW